MLRFFSVFLLIQAGLFTLQMLQPVQTAFIIPFTAQIAAVSAGLIQLFDSQVLSEGVIIQHSVNGFAVAIRSGCNGVEAIIILAAALFAFPRAPWSARLIGLAIGAVTIQILNIARIISLFYLGQWHPVAFEWAHLYLWEVLIMLDVLMVFLLWLQRLPKPQASHVTE